MWMRLRCSRSVGFARVVLRRLLLREGALPHYIIVNELASAHATCPVGAPTELASAHANCAVGAPTELASAHANCAVRASTAREPSYITSL